MHNAPILTSAFIQISQHESPHFNKPASQTDDTKLSILGKIVIGAISTIRNLLRAVSDPKILDKRMHTHPSDPLPFIGQG